MEPQDPAPAEYRHRSKIARPKEDLLLPGLRFKWYDLGPEEYVVSAALAEESRDQVRTDYEGKRIEFTMGFVILHIAGSTSNVGMLIVNTWRNWNEIWETVYLKDLPNNGPSQVYERSGHFGVRESSPRFQSDSTTSCSVPVCAAGTSRADFRPSPRR